MELAKTCPYCNEPYIAKPGKEFVFCTNCGQKIFLDEFREVVCPECHNRIQLRADRKKAFCPDCGASLIFEDEVPDHSDMTDRERVVAGMTDKALDRRQRLKIEKMRNKTVLKMKKIDAQRDPDNPMPAWIALGVMFVFSLIALLFL